MSKRFNKDEFEMPQLKVHITGWAYNENKERVEVDDIVEGHHATALVSTDDAMKSANYGAVNGHDEILMVKCLIEAIGLARYRMAHAIAMAITAAENGGNENDIGEAIAGKLFEMLNKRAAEADAVEKPEPEEPAKVDA